MVKTEKQVRLGVAVSPGNAGKDAGAPRLPVLTGKSSRTVEEYRV